MASEYIENKTTKDILWLKERSGVYVVDMMVARQEENRGQTAFWVAGHVAGLVSPNEPTEEHGLWDTESGCTR